MDILGTPDVVEDDLICSGKGCRAAAVWGLLWNNPKIHTPERRKVWLSCEDHREHLEHFLDLRGFLKSTVPVAELEQAGPTSDRHPPREPGNSASQEPGSPAAPQEPGTP